MAKDVDVIVVGSGGAGNTAAIMAAKAGASVMMLEAGERVGGSTALSGGVFMAGGTSVQRAAGVQDTPDALYQLYMAYNRWQLEPALVRRYCDEACRTIEWLIELGVEYKPEELYCSSIDDVARGHVPTGYGLEYFNTLHGHATTLGTQVVTNTRVTRLLADGGRVVGVHADGQDVFSDAVILACGGLGSNREMVEKYFPDAAQHPWQFYLGVDSNRGDAILLGQDVGAVVARTSLNHGVLALAPHFDQREVEGFFPTWLLFVNREGRRFMAEDAPYAVAGDIMNAQTDHCSWAIFDHYIFMNADGKGHFDTGMVGTTCPNWEHDVFERNLAKGRIIKADTIGELAEKCGIHADALVTNVERYNYFVRNGRDEQFFKDMKGTREIVEGPFYATEVRAATMSVAATGLQIDVDARVHNAADRPIPGLYAAGEAAGGVVGNCLGGGNSIGPPAVFGRIAGAKAAEYVKRLGQERG